ncbi:SGNH/GDSL hydrolase family protein [Metabacillus sp. GX 13764]|uniref:SGNH/GDSL hydrolase family protein n=1 Tax=Metabacillus kandeliae TaxID=2900151 RepID=UPI001E5F6BDD|nr:SGNH/GDSL hydrolase family protein [Metabacillus kandeliae]MCD7033468.1 SGNH/GDSL hydrolase family protein [Metabacillus kandeliae]
MVKQFAWIIAVLLLLAGCEGFSLKPAAPASKTVQIKKKEKPLQDFIRGDISIVGVGDSLTAGVGDDNKKGYIGYVQQKLMEEHNRKNISLTNYAVMGYRTDDLQKRLKRQEVINALKGADIIMLTIGGNDLMKVVKDNFLNLTFEPFRKEQVQYVKKTSEIMSTIRKLNPKAQIVFVGLYNPVKYAFPQLSEIDVIVKEWNNGAKEAVERDPNAKFVPIEDFFSSNDEKGILYKDAFHPNEAGYQLIGERVYQDLISDDSNENNDNQ